MYFVGWLRVGPKEWKAIGKHVDYETCWRGLRNDMAPVDRKKKWFDLIVLPKGEQPVSTQSSIPPDLAKDWDAKSWKEGENVEGLDS